MVFTATDVRRRTEAALKAALPGKDTIAGYPKVTGIEGTEEEDGETVTYYGAEFKLVVNWDSGASLSAARKVVELLEDGLIGVEEETD